MPTEEIMEKERQDKIRKGIAVYYREQRVFFRLLRKRGAFTETEFDSWFRHPRRNRRPLVAPTSETLWLGMGRNGHTGWAIMLELLQLMVAIDIIDARTINGKVVYSLMPSTKLF